MENKVVLERHKKSDYTVNFEGRKYSWSGAKGNIAGKREVPMELCDYLSMFTSCFSNGELIVKEAKNPDVKELVDNMYGKEEYDTNGLTKEQIIVILKGTNKKMETELEKVTSNSTKQFILQVAKEIKLDNSTKQKFIKEWIGSDLPLEDLFDEE